MRAKLKRAVGAYPAGTEVVLVEPLVWIVEVALPDDSLEGGFRYDTIEVPDSDLHSEAPRTMMEPGKN